MPRRTIATPVGPITIESAAGQLTAVRIGVDEGGRDADPLLDEAARQIGEYFRGERRDFDLPLAPPTSPRGAALRAAIAGIGHGETMSYGALARTIGSGPRAVGQACRRNPFPIVVPCHRVTSASGPEQYSAGAGVETKRRLLALETKERKDGGVDRVSGARRARPPRGLPRRPGKSGARRDHRHPGDFRGQFRHPPQGR